MSIVTFYCGDPNAPKTTQKTRLGANALIIYEDKLLLEKRSDCDLWGLVGGGVKNHETTTQAITREIYEELGLRIAEEKLEKLGIYDTPKRIAAYRDGSIWKMVIAVFRLKLEQKPVLKISRESRQLRFFSREELKDITIVVTHRDIVEDWFLNLKNPG